MPNNVRTQNLRSPVQGQKDKRVRLLTNSRGTLLTQKRSILPTPENRMPNAIATANVETYIAIHAVQLSIVENIIWISNFCFQSFGLKLEQLEQEIEENKFL